MAERPRPSDRSSRKDKAPPSEPPRGGITVVVQQPELFNLDTFWGPEGGEHSFETSNTSFGVIDGRGNVSEKTTVTVRLPQPVVTDSSETLEDSLRRYVSNMSSFTITSEVRYNGVPPAGFLDQRQMKDFTMSLRDRGLEVEKRGIGMRKKYPSLFIIDRDAKLAFELARFYGNKRKGYEHQFQELVKQDPTIDISKFKQYISSSFHVAMGRLLDEDPNQPHTFQGLYRLTPENIPYLVMQYADGYEQILNALFDGFGTTPEKQVILRPPLAGGDTLTKIQYAEGRRPIHLSKEDVDPSVITFKDIVGQDEAVEDARRLVLAINQPEVYEKRGGVRPKGIMFHGPPGNGKTLLAKALAHEAQAEFISFTAADIMSKWYGESEQRIQGIFDQANRLVLAGKKVVVFIDEVDALAKDRGTLKTDGGTTDRIVSLLLQNMDGMNSNANVTIIAATNNLEKIDSAFLRDGRMDKKIFVGNPSENGRAKILDLHMRKAQQRAKEPETIFDPDIDMTLVAQATAGFSGANLANLINLTIEDHLFDELEQRGWRPVKTEDLLRTVRKKGVATKPTMIFGFAGGAKNLQEPNTP